MPSLDARIVTLLLSAGTVGGLQAQAAPPDLSDPEVAHVAVTANSIDIDFGKLAESRSRNGEIRKFAETMVTDHSAVNDQATALAGKLGVTPKDNAVSESLIKAAAEAKGKMTGLRGAAFDRAYIDREVAYHQAVLDALDHLLIPTTSNGELKGLLEKVRPAIAAHLEHARRIQASLEGAR